MIKIKKDFSKVPDSLQIPSEEFFPDGIPRPSKTTHKRRLELIKNGKYIDEKVYNDRYKQSDTRRALMNIYKNKCAYCEQNMEQNHVEHYRPKHIYYWLAYSWDNLILACAFCNLFKDVNFDLLGTKLTFRNTAKNINAIHVSSKKNDKQEMPKMVNPEVTDPYGKIQFKQNGIIESEDERFAYTIEKCRIDRKHLNDGRRKILDIFQRDINSSIVENPTTDKQEIEIEAIVRKFVRDSKDEDLPFLAFRRFAISNWLSDLVIEVKP